jgi:hypothetical protein
MSDLFSSYWSELKPFALSWCKTQKLSKKALAFVDTYFTQIENKKNPFEQDHSFIEKLTPEWSAELLEFFGILLSATSNTTNSILIAVLSFLSMKIPDPKLKKLEEKLFEHFFDALSKLITAYVHYSEPEFTGFLPAILSLLTQQVVSDGTIDRLKNQTIDGSSYFCQLTDGLLSLDKVKVSTAIKQMLDYLVLQGFMDSEEILGIGKDEK